MVRVNVYCTPDQVRFFSGLDENDTPDSEASRCIRQAEEDIVRDISIEVDDLRAWGDIDGSNVNFYVNHYPIADRDYDALINANDVTVYGWSDSDDPDTKSVLTVSSVVSNDGKIVLSTAPDESLVEKITVDYRFYLKPIDWGLVTKATSLLAGHYAARRLYQLKPVKYTLGPLRVEYSTQWTDNIWKEYKRTVRMITGAISDMSPSFIQWKTWSSIETDRTAVKLTSEYQ
jgi:hypothetical protein